MKGVIVLGEELPACLAEPVALVDAVLGDSLVWALCLNIARGLDDAGTLDESMLRSLLGLYAP